MQRIRCVNNNRDYNSLHPAPSLYEAIGDTESPTAHDLKLRYRIQENLAGMNVAGGGTAARRSTLKGSATPAKVSPRLMELATTFAHSPAAPDAWRRWKAF